RFAGPDLGIDQDLDEVIDLIEELERLCQPFAGGAVRAPFAEPGGVLGRASVSGRRGYAELLGEDRVLDLADDLLTPSVHELAERVLEGGARIGLHHEQAGDVDLSGRDVEDLADIEGEARAA